MDSRFNITLYTKSIYVRSDVEALYSISVIFINRFLHYCDNPEYQLILSQKDEYSHNTCVKSTV